MEKLSEDDDILIENEFINCTEALKMEKLIENRAESYPTIENIENIEILEYCDLDSTQWNENYLQPFAPEQNVSIDNVFESFSVENMENSADEILLKTYFQQQETTANPSNDLLNLELMNQQACNMITVNEDIKKCCETDANAYAINADFDWSAFITRSPIYSNEVEIYNQDQDTINIADEQQSCEFQELNTVNLNNLYCDFDKKFNLSNYHEICLHPEFNKFVHEQHGQIENCLPNYQHTSTNIYGSKLFLIPLNKDADIEDKAKMNLLCDKLKRHPTLLYTLLNQNTSDDNPSMVIPFKPKHFQTKWEDPNSLEQKFREIDKEELQIPLIDFNRNNGEKVARKQSLNLKNVSEITAAINDMNKLTQNTSSKIVKLKKKATKQVKTKMPKKTKLFQADKYIEHTSDKVIDAKARRFSLRLRDRTQKN